MSLSTDREIAMTRSPRVPAELIQSIFVAELIRPSRRLWLASPWISDVDLIDNRARQFASLCPDWPAAWIGLTRVLEALLVRGSRVTIITNDDAHNRHVRERVQALGRVYEGQTRTIVDENLHEKGIVGDWFSLSGSMNLTYHGIFVNQEHLVYTCDESRVSERRIGFELRWGTDA